VEWYGDRTRRSTDWSASQGITAPSDLRWTDLEQFVMDRRRRIRFVAGNIALQSREEIRKLFEDNGWRLLDRDWIIQHLGEMATAKYEDDIAMMVAKLLGSLTNSTSS
jgi:hypothetical protein